MIRSCHITLLLVLAFGYARAQEYVITDYLVTPRGDTLTGKIALLFGDTNLEKVEVAAKGKKIILLGKQVKSVRIGRDTYQSIWNEGSYHFMKQLKVGYLSLYAFREPNKDTYDGRLLVKRDGASLEVPTAFFRTAVAKFLADCEAVHDEVRGGKIGKTQLTTIIDQYNTCMEQVTKKKLKETPISLGPSPGYAALEKLKEKVTNLPDSQEKKNTLDLLNDMSNKLLNAQPVPDYLINTLNGYIGGNAQVQAELQKFLEELKKN